MIAISNSIEIARPVPQVFAYVIEFDHNPEWMPVQAVHRLSDGPVVAGTRFRQLFHLLGADYEMDCLIVDCAQDSKLSFQYDAPVFSWRGDYLFEPTGAGTRLSARGQVALNGPLKMAENMLAPKIRRLINETAPNLKQILER